MHGVKKKKTQIDIFEKDRLEHNNQSSIIV